MRTAAVKAFRWFACGRLHGAWLLSRHKEAMVAVYRYCTRSAHHTYIRTLSIHPVQVQHKEHNCLEWAHGASFDAHTATATVVKAKIRCAATPMVTARIAPDTVLSLPVPCVLLLRPPLSTPPACVVEK
jgi:hypothetical protein